MPDNVKFFTISQSEFDSRVSTTDSTKKLVVGGLYFVHDDTNANEGVLHRVVTVTSSGQSFTATTEVYGHRGLSASTGTASDAGKVPLLGSTGKLDNSFFSFINNGKIDDSYISSLYLNEYKGEYDSTQTLEGLTTSSTGTNSQPLDINPGDWAVVNDTTNNVYGPYICTSITASGSTWQKIGSPLGDRTTDISQDHTDRYIPTALAVKDYVDSAITGGALNWENIPNSGT